MIRSGTHIHIHLCILIIEDRGRIERKKGEERTIEKCVQDTESEETSICFKVQKTG